ncbi:MAG: phenylalanine--tRNA ligase subunit alpha [Anaerolineaceae bacterium]|nr:phenylalanine--tRNA ligase subunit alpha [Anaerolineaceae bacterium]
MKQTLASSLESIRDEAIRSLEDIPNLEDLHDWEIARLGRRGALTQLLRQTGQLAPSQRPAFGKRANAIKAELQQLLEERSALLHERALMHDLEHGAIDVTLPGRHFHRGGIHPSTQTLRNFYEIWSEMGFQVFRSREVEDDAHNFEMLNFPPHHPARDMQDSFYTDRANIILRTHTSPGQIRAMHALSDNGTQPIRVILPGMCFRYEQISARSEVQFTQVEGLAVGRALRFSDLKGTIHEFAKRMFGDSVRVRYRASYFPFTEPSMEVDVECFLCKGQGCSVCKHSGWLEVAGSGMVHPVVLRNGGYDPAIWSGFAFGMGPERLTMLKHGIHDIRYFWSNDIRFLEQF